MENKLKVGTSLSIFHCNLSDDKARKHLGNVFWQETLKAWQNMVGELRLNGESVLEQSLWHNKTLNLEAHPTIPKAMLLRHGLFRVKDLYSSEERRIMTHGELRNRYGFGNFLLWQALIEKIPQEWKRLL